MLTAWRCGGILCSVCRQLKPIKDIMFNGFYCCSIYNFKLELPMNSELLPKLRTSCPAIAKLRLAAFFVLLVMSFDTSSKYPFYFSKVF
jgi:hypothetical protein